MDNDTVKHLWALREVNKGLILGLKTALSVMEGWDDISPDRRQSTMDTVKKLVEQSEKAYGTEPTEINPECLEAPGYYPVDSHLLPCWFDFRGPRELLQRPQVLGTMKRGQVSG